MGVALGTGGNGRSPGNPQARDDDDGDDVDDDADDDVALPSSMVDCGQPLIEFVDARSTLKEPPIAVLLVMPNYPPARSCQ